MQGSPDDPFVYQLRWNHYGSAVPWQYSYVNRNGRGMKGAVLESVFMGNESRVRQDIEDGKLPALPWNRD
jgi:hypothetical protein